MASQSYNEADVSRLEARKQARTEVTSHTFRAEALIELGNIYTPSQRESTQQQALEEGLALRRFSSKRTFTSVSIPVNSPQSERIQYLFNTKRKVFCLQVLPLSILFMFNTFLTTKEFGSCAELELINCYDRSAEFVRAVMFVYLIFLTYIVRKELIEKRECLLGNVDGAFVGKIATLLYGTPKRKKLEITPNEFKDLILGRLPARVDAKAGVRLPGNKFYHIRGFLLLPSFICSGFALHNASYYIAIGINEPAFIFIHTLYVFTCAFVALQTVRSCVVPFILMCLQVGNSARERIGLWNHSDVAMNEMQRVSMHFALLFSGAAFIFITLMTNWRLYFIVTTTELAMYCILGVGIALSIVLLPIAPIVLVLRKKKEEVLADVFVVLERTNLDLLDKYRNDEDTAKAKAELDRINQYYAFVKATNTVPSELETVRTIIFSVSATFVPVIIGLILGKG